MFETNGDKKAMELAELAAREMEKSPRDRLLDQMAIAMTEDETFLNDLSKRVASKIDKNDLAERVACEISERDIINEITEQFENNVSVTEIAEEMAKDCDVASIIEGHVGECLNDLDEMVDTALEDEDIPKRLAKSLAGSDKMDSALVDGAAQKLVLLMGKRIGESDELRDLLDKLIMERAQRMLATKFGLGE